MLLSETRVRDFMSGGVLSTRVGSLVSEAVKAMVLNNVGSIVVSGERGPVGIVTEWNLLRMLPRQGAFPEPTLVEAVMTPGLVRIGPEESITETAKTMVRTRGRLVVFEGGQMVGMVSATDLVRTIETLSAPFSLERTMSRRIVRISSQTTIGLAIQHMAEKRIGSVLVAGDSIAYGIFTERDVLKRVIAPTLRLNAPVKTVATFPLITAQKGIDGLGAARVMSKNSIKKLPLFDGDNPFAIVTARDVVEAFATSFG